MFCFPFDITSDDLMRNIFPVLTLGCHSNLSHGMEIVFLVNDYTRTISVRFVKIRDRTFYRNGSCV